mgnify:CR=1 FL=1
MGSASKNRIKTRLWKYLMEKGPQPYAAMVEDLDWIGSSREISMLMDRCYLFERVGTEMVVQGGIAGATSLGGGYPVAVWGALPLDIAAKQFLTPRKHQIRPLAKQPAFVKKYVEDKLNEQNK